MKKLFIAAASFAVVAVTAMVAAPTTSEAVPAFARQTGAACLSCHFQVFPALTPFGQAFKRGGFTDVGEESLLEDDGLSLPVVLNMSVNSRVRLRNDKTETVTAGVATNTTVKASQMPDETPLFIGGRVGTNTGVFMEWTSNPAGGWQLLNSFDVGDFKAGVNLFNAGFGWTWGLEESSVYGQHGGVHWGKNISAQEALNAGNSFGYQGVTGFVGNDLFVVTVNMVTAGGNTLNGMNFLGTLLPGVRVFVTPEVAGWNLGFGGGYIKGTKSVNASGGGANTNTVHADNLFLDFQAMGDVGDTSVGIFADYATAKGPSSATVPALVDLMGQTAGSKYSGYSLRATVEPIHAVILSAGFGKQTLKQNLTASPDQKTTYTTLGISYSLYQNMEIALIRQVQKITNNVNVAADTSKVTTTALQIEAVM